MAAYTADSSTLLLKKFGGLVLIVLGVLGIAIGFESGSNGCLVAGIIALALGMGLLVLKIIRRNAT
ncbi:hypothetical protein H8A97_34315 [Bradyrhizobium sp. Arg62]|uniref:hypothetical protein n=1 Tax=Bradyrhizobium brasilense TaxID=1419277 RepID=UPI001E29200A|nr:hypothetical protein [Bradyrhizobium brasilense]MCC8950028.1 hypothetical protein [Bradyrhizobium brasilense]